MFKSVKYNISAGFDFIEVKIRVKGNELRYSKIVTGKPDEYADDKVSPIPVDDFARKIENLHIYDWNRKYEAKNNAEFDMASWTVVYEEMDGKKHKCSGDKLYPANWKAFRELISTVVGKVELE